MQVFSFGNFFYSSDRGGQHDVNAVGAEYRGGWRIKQSPTEVYANVSTLGYSRSGLSRAYGTRLGVWNEDKNQEYRVFVDFARNRPASAIRNAGTANRDMLYGEYGYNFAPAWQVAANATHEKQDIRNQPQRNSTLNAVEGVVKYRGFGWQVTPHAGVVGSRRSVNDNTESYHDRGAFVGVEWMPITPLYLSFDLRGVSRRFDSAVAHGGNERHNFVEVIGDYHAMRRLRFSLYYQREHVGSPLSGQSFNADVLIAGTTWTF
ncbi:MAG: hypothetical protein M3041_01195 [Acidobacteriota bacterium]|nr:hypothetical protein [Acidobacteriota bacterium]